MNISLGYLIKRIVYQMTGTKNIPIKNLLLHISNVINACDLSSVTPYRVKQYLKYRFKNALPSEDDLDTILKNVIKSFKLSQALNGGSAHFREVNYDSLDTYEAKLKDTMVEYETKDYILTKEGLSKEQIINSNIKRVDPKHYALQNFTPKALRNIRQFVKQKKKQTGFVQRRKRLAEIMKRSEFLWKKRKRLGEIVNSRRRQNVRKQKKTKRQRKNGPQENVRELSAAEKRPQIVNKPTEQKKATRLRKKPTEQKKTTRLRKNGPQENIWELSQAVKRPQIEDKPTEQKKATRPRKKPTEQKKATRLRKNGPQENVWELSPAEKRPEIANRKKKPLSEEMMDYNSVWDSQVTGELKLCFKRSFLVDPYHGEDAKLKTVPKKKQKTNTKNLREKNVSKRKNTPAVGKTPQPEKKSERLTRLNFLCYLQDNFGDKLSSKQLIDIIKATSDEFEAVMKCTELCN